LAHIFKNLLPDLKGKNILDIGSRFGAVLFGAYVYSQASNIAGVELNADLATLCQVMVQRYNMQVLLKYKFSKLMLY
jgi:tRNA1(Val) A37 N6-methylase TrmN6